MVDSLVSPVRKGDAEVCIRPITRELADAAICAYGGGLWAWEGPESCKVDLSIKRRLVAEKGSVEERTNCGRSESGAGMVWKWEIGGGPNDF